MDQLRSRYGGSRTTEFPKEAERTTTQGKTTGEDGEEARTQTPSTTFSRAPTAPPGSRTVVKSSETVRHHRGPNAALAEPSNSGPRPSQGSGAPSLERQAPKKPEAAKNYKTAPRSYRFQRGRTRGIIEVLDENDYVMAEYRERTGSVQWQRVVLASQREQIEKWLEEHYPRA